MNGAPSTNPEYVARRTGFGRATLLANARRQVPLQEIDRVRKEDEAYMEVPGATEALAKKERRLRDGQVSMNTMYSSTAYHDEDAYVDEYLNSAEAKLVLSSGEAGGKSTQIAYALANQGVKDELSALRTRPGARTYQVDAREAALGLAWKEGLQGVQLSAYAKRLLADNEEVGSIDRESVGARMYLLRAPVGASVRTREEFAAALRLLQSTTFYSTVARLIRSTHVAIENSQAGEEVTAFCGTEPAHIFGRTVLRTWTERPSPVSTLDICIVTFAATSMVLDHAVFIRDLHAVFLFFYPSEGSTYAIFVFGMLEIDPASRERLDAAFPAGESDVFRIAGHKIHADAPLRNGSGREVVRGPYSNNTGSVHNKADADGRRPFLSILVRDSLFRYRDAGFVPQNPNLNSRNRKDPVSPPTPRT